MTKKTVFLWGFGAYECFGDSAMGENNDKSLPNNDSVYWSVRIPNKRNKNYIEIMPNTRNNVKYKVTE